MADEYLCVGCTEKKAWSRNKLQFKRNLHIDAGVGFHAGQVVGTAAR